MKKIINLVLVLILFIGCKTIDVEKEVKKGDIRIGNSIVVSEEEEKYIDLSNQEYYEVNQDHAVVEEDVYSYDIEPIIVPVTKYIVMEGGGSQKSPTSDRSKVKDALKNAEVSVKDFIGGTCIYDYDENNIYPVYCKELQFTTIVLNKDEVMDERSPIYTGDSLRWQIIGDVWQTTSGEYQIVMIKPKSTNISTNMLIMTNKRLYQFKLYSINDGFQPMIKFRYPLEREFIYKNTKKVKVSTPIEKKLSELDWSEVSVNYEIKVGASSKDVDWIPKFVYDDGSQTYIVFPEVILQKEFPALWEGRNQITNFHVDSEVHNMIRIDKLINKLTLAIGNDRVVIVKKKGKSETVKIRGIQ